MSVLFFSSFPIFTMLTLCELKKSAIAEFKARSEDEKSSEIEEIIYMVAENRMPDSREQLFEAALSDF